MPRSPSVSPYHLHTPSGRAVVTVRTADSARRDVYLGKFNSEASHVGYRRITAELATAVVREPVVHETPNPTSDQVVFAL